MDQRFRGFPNSPPAEGLRHDVLDAAVRVSQGLHHGRGRCPGVHGQQGAGNLAAGGVVGRSHGLRQVRDRPGIAQRGQRIQGLRPNLGGGIG